VAIVAFAIILACAAACIGWVGACALRQARLTLIADQAIRKDIEVKLLETREILSRTRLEAARLEHQRAQLAAENERIRQRRHTHATAECFEDAMAACLDIQTELQMAVPAIRANKDLYRYINYQVGRIRDILAKGRPSPYAYRSEPTYDRPARPGVMVMLGD
jgi:hypothetical protein